MPQGPLANFHTPLLNIIFSFIKSYYFVGENSLVRVCRHLNPSFNKSLKIRELSLAIILAEPLEPDDVLNIFNHPILSPQLSHQDLLHLASLHPQLADKIKDRVQRHELPLLLKSHPQIASSMWRNPESWNGKVSWAHIAKYHIPLANLVVLKLSNALHSGHRDITIGEWFPNIPDQLVELGSINSATAETIYNSDIVMLKMGRAVLELGTRHLTIALKVFDLEKMKKASTIEPLYIQMAINFGEITKLLMTVPNIIDKLPLHDIIALAKKHDFVAKLLADDPKLQLVAPADDHVLEGTNALVHIASVHEWLAIKIFADKPLLNSFSGIQLAILTQNYSWAWSKIKETPDLFSKLKTFELAHAGSKTTEIATDILTSTPCLAQFSLPEFYIFIERKPEIALATLNQLDVTQHNLKFLPLLFKSHLSVALEMLKSPVWLTALLTFPISKLISYLTPLRIKEKLLALPEAVKKLTKTDLKMLSETYPHLIKKIKSKPDLLAKFNTDKRYMLRTLEADVTRDEKLRDCIAPVVQQQALLKKVTQVEIKPLLHAPLSLHKTADVTVTPCSSPQKIVKRHS